jgi:hypothetical protein
MYRWQCQIPKGMFLKSEACASNLSDPTARYTLARYCAERRLPYGESGALVFPPMIQPLLSSQSTRTLL